jgi:hypothetical protein
LSRRQEVKAILDLALNQLSTQPDGELFPASRLLQFLEAAVLLQDRTSAAVLFNRLSGEVVWTSGGNTGLTGVTRQIGAAALLLGKPDDARAYYILALEACAKIRFRPEIALTRLQLAELLLEHYPDERAEALDHLDFAVAEFRDMKMQPSLERALRHRGLLKA